MLRDSTNALRRRLKALLHGVAPVIVPGAYDALSALLVQQAGFQAVHLGSYSIASAMGVPDMGQLGLHELVAATAQVTRVLDLPLIADAEDGFRPPTGIWQTVQAFEDIGAAAIHIEDHLSGKHTTLPRRVMPLQDMVARIRAAVAARRDADFMVIARTDIAWASGDMALTLERVNALSAAGADAVMVLGLSLDQLAGLRPHCRAKLVVLSAGDASAQQQAQAGADMVIHHDHCLSNAIDAVRNGLQEFNAAIASQRAPRRIDPLPQLRSLVGYDKAQDQDQG